MSLVLGSLGLGGRYFGSISLSFVASDLDFFLLVGMTITYLTIVMGIQLKYIFACMYMRF